MTPVTNEGMISEIRSSFAISFQIDPYILTSIFQNKYFSMSSTTDTALGESARQMKRDWDERAAIDAKWFINCVKLGQTDEEFDATGLSEVQRFITADLRLLIGDRDPRSLRLLEIGCGIGRMTKHLADIFGEVYGTDVSAEMIRMARERLHSRPNIRLIETNGCDFAGLPDESFDLIFSAYVFQHVPSKEIIYSNIRDAYRLLKPGCLFKFAVSGVVNSDFLQIPKDTWTGVSLFEEDLRRIAREIGAQLMRITGVGTQYCWILLRKPRPSLMKRTSGANDQRDRRERPAIVDFGSHDDLNIKEVPSSGEGASVGLIVTGLNPEEVDANNLTIELDGRSIKPCYVGPRRDGLTAELQIDFPVPTDHPGGKASLLLRRADGAASESMTITILPPQPVAPKIQLISNVFDGGLEIYAGGPKSKIRLFTEGLNERADTTNVRVHLGTESLVPESISFIPGNAVWLVTVQLPEGTRPGETEVRVSFNELASLPLPLEIKEVAADPA